jgi:hypothetical protein
VVRAEIHTHLAYNGGFLMNIYNSNGDMADKRVSDLAENMATRAGWLVDKLLAEGTPVVEIRAMLTYLENELSYAVTMRLMAHRIDAGGWPVPVKVQGLYPLCSSEDCPHHKECANHTSAGAYRSLHGDTPALIMVGSEWLCTKCPESHGRGAILIDGTFMEKR